jgi:3-dehydroquinate dehydratase/shikimate dehydrogenase
MVIPGLSIDIFLPPGHARFMLCISINQESRRLALADMVNAGRSADLLEIRLDRFGKAPDLGELLGMKPKPAIMTCRRPEDGGHWDGSEEERLAILRQCVISKAEYVELELDIADNVRRYGPTQRVISYTNLQETPENIVEIYDQARGKNPDVIKLVTLARTPEEAWPLVQILAKSSTPTVIVGLGKANVMLALLGRKLNAPWIYAALERGMEAYPGQPTVDDLIDIYRVGDIHRSTRFFGIIGHGPGEIAMTACLNAAFATAEMNLRCLPLEVGSLKTLGKLIEVVKLAGVVIDSRHQEAILDLQPSLRGTARTTRAADLIVSKDDVLHGFHKGAKIAAGRLEAAFREKFAGDKPFQDRFVLFAGMSPTAKLLAAEIREQGGNVILASHDKIAGQQFATEAQCRFIAFEALYSTLHDALVVCDVESERGKPAEIHPGYLKPGQIVMDLTAEFTNSQFLREAAVRSTIIVSAFDVFVDRATEFARTLTGQPIRREAMLAAIPRRLLED